MMNVDFWVNLLGDPVARNSIRRSPTEELQRLIDQMENDIPHDQLPPHYDWLVALRNSR